MIRIVCTVPGYEGQRAVADFAIVDAFYEKISVYGGIGMAIYSMPQWKLDVDSLQEITETNKGGMGERCELPCVG